MKVAKTIGKSIILAGVLFSFNAKAEIFSNPNSYKIQPTVIDIPSTQAAPQARPVNMPRPAYIPKSETMGWQTSSGRQIDVKYIASQVYKVDVVKFNKNPL
jgi:hypothetical protein